ncbi:hypothetical protein [Halioglobus sp. HI00S01]|uniref:hypothetical protein n=1 Tax=Halioglobus sp. HI00S01 TaxID=1822214 RepID=UPI0012E72F1F|nr:hypothetical protein [Halioglobus sp. HI00S01]
MAAEAITDDFDTQPYEDKGYIMPTMVNGMVCGLTPLVFTWGVCTGIDETGYRNRFCFETLLDAISFLTEWDGLAAPTVGEDGCVALRVQYPEDFQQITR